LLDEIVVLLVRADPKPHCKITMPARQSAIAVSDSDRPDFPDERLEMHRRMKRIALPKSKLFSGESLNFSW
jgi:hypothetical protein